MTGEFYRRNLPHWQPERSTIFLTWRLHGSLPKGLAEHLRKFVGEAGKQFALAEFVLDAAANGPLWLKDAEIAQVAERAILRGCSLGQYELRAYVVMPNHVHVLLDPLVPIQRLTSGIKGVSARHANLKLGRTGERFWQDESFDHWIRNEGQLVRAKAYIENNPVKAGLCARPEDWRWSSAKK
jgi:REP element-mobilizing transposase RayT